MDTISKYFALMIPHYMSMNFFPSCSLYIGFQFNVCKQWAWLMENAIKSIIWPCEKQKGSSCYSTDSSMHYKNEAEGSNTSILHELPQDGHTSLK